MTEGSSPSLPAIFILFYILASAQGKYNAATLCVVNSSYEHRGTEITNSVSINCKGIN